MIELTDEQARAVAQASQPLTVVNPKTQETFVLVRKDVFDVMRQWLEPFQRGWDDPCMDVYDQPPNQR
jgi:hypothetical protein